MVQIEASIINDYINSKHIGCVFDFMSMMQYIVIN